MRWWKAYPASSKSALSPCLASLPLAAVLATLVLAACNRGAPANQPPAAEQQADKATEAKGPVKEEPAVSQSNHPALARINELLAKHPASEKVSGVKHAKVRAENGKLVIEVSPTQRKQTDRYEAPIASLDLSQMGTEVTPEHNVAQVYIPCRNGEECATWHIRDEGSTEWRLARNDSEIGIDFAPDQAVADELKSLLGRWLSEQK